jgi:hypothetical protein
MKPFKEKRNTRIRNMQYQYYKRREAKKMKHLVVDVDVEEV